MKPGGSETIREQLSPILSHERIVHVHIRCGETLGKKEVGSEEFIGFIKDIVSVFSTEEEGRKHASIHFCDQEGRAISISHQDYRKESTTIVGLSLVNEHEDEEAGLSCFREEVAVETIEGSSHRSARVAFLNYPVLDYPMGVDQGRKVVYGNLVPPDDAELRRVLGAVWNAYKHSKEHNFVVGRTRT